VATNDLTRVYSRKSGVLECDKSTASTATNVVTQGVHLKGKPVLNGGTAILNLFMNSELPGVTN
jgi:hypothetical protein